MSLNKKARVHQVTKARWQKAQNWELNYWSTLDKRISQKKVGASNILRSLISGRKTEVELDDWNYWWKEKFDDYQFVPKSIDSAIELGCGPYTNMRLIARQHLIRKVVCSDPLVSYYAKFENGWLRSANNNHDVVLVQHPAESAPFSDCSFDCVILINVLDHVFNAEACMMEAYRLTKTDGILIVGQDLTNDEDMNNIMNIKDVGHPIRIDHEWFENFFRERFNTILYKLLSRHEGRAPSFHYGTLIFAGKRL